MSYKDHQLGHNRSASVNQSAETVIQVISISAISSWREKVQGNQSGKKPNKNVYTFVSLRTKDDKKNGSKHLYIVKYIYLCVCVNRTPIHMKYETCFIYGRCRRVIMHAICGIPIIHIYLRIDRKLLRIKWKTKIITLSEHF